MVDYLNPPLIEAIEFFAGEKLIKQLAVGFALAKTTVSCDEYTGCHSGTDDTCNIRAHCVHQEEV